MRRFVEYPSSRQSAFALPGTTHLNHPMTVIGIHASHKHIHPARLLSEVRRAQEAGFAAAMCSDHFSPWSERLGHSAFAWSWLAAALATTDLPFCTGNVRCQRYHPAIIAQAKK